MKKLNIYFYLFLFISSVNTSNIEAESDKLDHYDQDEDGESIESVDFISQPVKKKTIKTKKISS